MTKETKMYNAMLVDALMTMGMAVIELQNSRNDIAADGGVTYSPEMMAIAKNIKDNGYEKTKQQLTLSFDAGKYDLFMDDVNRGYKEPYRIVDANKNEYVYEDISTAVQYYFSLPENEEKQLFYDCINPYGKTDNYLLIATKDTKTERYMPNSGRDDVNRAAKALYAASDIYLLDRYISDYGNDRRLVVERVENGFNYVFLKDGEEKVKGRVNTVLNIYFADYMVKQSIFDYGVNPENGKVIAKVNSREYLDIFGQPPYEFSYIWDNASEIIDKKTEVETKLDSLRKMYRYNFSITQSDLEQLVMDVVSDKITAAGLDVDKIDYVIIEGSYSNGTNNKYSDLDVHIVYSGKCAIADLERVLAADPLIVDGVTVDMHPCNSELFDIDGFISSQQAYLSDLEDAQIRNMSAEICDLLYGDNEEVDNYRDIVDCIRLYDGKSEGDQMLRMDIQKVNQRFAENKLSFEYLKSKELIDFLDTMKEKHIVQSVAVKQR